MTESRRSALNIIEHFNTKRGLKARIIAKCVDCIYDEQMPGTWRKQVHDCQATDCPLWPVRPLSGYAAYAENATNGAVDVSGDDTLPQKR